MNKLILGTVAVLAIVVVSGFAIASSGSSDTVAEQSAAVVTETPTAEDAISVDTEDQSQTEQQDDLPSEETGQEAEPADEAPAPTEVELAINTSGSNYVDYADGVIEDTAGTKIVFFHADWCPKCNALDADIKTSGIRSDVTIIKANYDDETALKDKYGVSFQTTTVLIDDSGNLIESFYAGGDPRVEAVLAAFNI